jgi:hypothetical protein
MVPDKDTKRTVRFAAEREDAPVKTVYVSKDSELSKAPALNVTLEETQA